MEEVTTMVHPWTMVPPAHRGRAHVRGQAVARRVTSAKVIDRLSSCGKVGETWGQGQLWDMNCGLICG